MMLGFGSLSVLNFFLPIVFFIFCVWLLCPVQGISFSIISSSLVFISLLKFSHPSLLFRFHFSRMVFFHGRLVIIVVIVVLWSVSFFPFYSTFLIYYVWCGLVYAPGGDCIVKWLISILFFFSVDSGLSSLVSNNVCRVSCFSGSFSRISPFLG